MCEESRSHEVSTAPTKLEAGSRVCWLSHQAAASAPPVHHLGMIGWELGHCSPKSIRSRPLIPGSAEFAVIKHNQTCFGEERIYFIIHFQGTVHLWGKSGRSSKQELRQRPQYGLGPGPPNRDNSSSGVPPCQVSLVSN